MERPSFQHRVERTRNKHSRAVYRGNTIIIRLAGNLTKTEEREHIESLLKRMTRLVVEERKKVVIDPFRPLLNGGQSVTIRLATGKKIVFSLHPAAVTGARKTAKGWRIDIGPRIRSKALHRLLWATLASRELPRLRMLVKRINIETLRVPYRDVKLSFATTQWGSCSSRGDIMLNAALLFVPSAILKYVIIHELAHRVHPNHSRAYWATVEKAMPRYEAAYKLLKQYRLPQW